MQVTKKVAGPNKFSTYDAWQGNTVKLYALASDGPTGVAGAFADLTAAMNEAQHFIFIADWSFQPYARLTPVAPANVTQTVGHLLVTKARALEKSGFLNAIHTWDHTGLGAADEQNDAGDNRLSIIAGGVRPPNVLWRASSRNGVGWSFHQKFVVLDAPEPSGRRVLKAFYGGLDLTKGRWDFGDHAVLPDGATMAMLREPLVHGSLTYDDWYNQEFQSGAVTPKRQKGTPGRDAAPGDLTMPRQPWQDYYAQLVGPAAWDFVREFVGRWNVDDSTPFASPAIGNTGPFFAKKVLDKFKALFDKGAFVQQWEKAKGPFVAQVVRSIEKSNWGAPGADGSFGLFADKVETPTENGSKQREFTWQLKASFEKSIQERYIRAISNAANFVYIETQYFIGSGAQWEDKTSSVKNAIPKTIVDKIKTNIELGHDFHAYIVLPMYPEGPPGDGAIKRQRFFEWQTMQFMAKTIAPLAKAKGKDWKDFLSFYFLANWTNVTPADAALTGDRRTRVSKNKRYMVYVHSKLMIVDDEFLIVGSANLNERSLAGDRDAEICVCIEPDEGTRDACVDIVRGLRRTAWTQHLGTLPADFDTPGKASCANAVQDKARENWRQMRLNNRPDGSGHLLALPLFADEKSFFVEGISTTQELRDQDRFIFDAEAKPAGPPGNGSIIKSEWQWSSPDSFPVPHNLAE